MRILILDDGNKGNLIQSLGIAKFFPSSEIVIKKISLKGPSYTLIGRKGKYKFLSKIITIFCLLKLWKFAKLIFELSLLEKEKFWKKKRFDYIISSGSYLSPINLLISKLIGAKSINIMVPFLLPLNFFDIVIMPYHDYLKIHKNKKNIIVTIGAPNCIDEKSLEDGRKSLEKVINIPPNSNIIGILLGGNDNNYSISIEWIKNFLKVIDKLNSNIKFFISTSKRTEKKVVEFIKEYIEKFGKFLYAEFPGLSQNSHYLGIIGLSNYIFVTEDSINMISEAITGGKPTLILGVERKNKRKLIFDFTIEKLVKENYAEYLPENKISEIPEMLKKMEVKNYKKLDEARECALKILKIIH